MRQCDRPIQSIVSTITLDRVERNFRIGTAKLNRTNALLLRDALRAFTFLQHDIAIHHNIPLDVLVTHLFSDDDYKYDIICIIGFCSDLRDYLIRVPDSDLSYRFLRAECARIARSNDMPYWKTLLRPINGLVRKFCDKASRRYVLKDISSYLLFFKKMPFTDIGIEEKMLDAYLADEGHFATAEYDPDMCDAIADIIHEWFQDFRIEDLRPFHGNGSTAYGKLNKYEKYLSMDVDSILLRFLNVDESLAYELFPLIRSKDLQRVSKLQFVPKTATKLRTISMEPPSLMYIQEGIRVELQRYIRKHRVLRHVIKFDDQTQNQMLAHIGSMLQNIATIDLSAASDSVSLQLVRKLFRKVPFLYKCCMMTRSTHTLLPNGDVIKLNKFAPMGSAMSFPVECIIFAAIVEYSYRTYQGIEKSLERRYFSIYGDDIICNDYLATTVMNNLSRLHFRVNRDKSFTGGILFRESCGVEYYDGIDVKPIYYRIRSRRSGSAPERYAAHIGMQHTCIDNGYNACAGYFTREVLRHYAPIFSDDNTDTSALYSTTATNYHLIKPDRRSSADYQDDYFFYDCVKAQHRRSSVDCELYEWIRYFDWLVSHKCKSAQCWTDILFPEDTSTYLLDSVPVIGHNSTVRMA